MWFLDIPIDYVHYAYKHCLYFNKNFMESRKIVEKGINIENTEHYITPYQPIVKGEGLKEQEEEDPGRKIRQILIARSRSQGLS